MTDTDATIVDDMAGPVDINRIMQMIPHRYPMLMVDRVVDIQPNHSAVGIKNVTINEPHFVGHFPVKPVMPGVLIIECMAQTSAVLFARTLGKGMEGKVVYFMTIDDAKFRKPVVPGDRVEYHVTQSKKRGNIWKFDCVAQVDGVKVAEAVVSAMLSPRGPN